MREIGLGPNGMMNPDADKRCGAINTQVLLPEPIHWGGCKECHRIIRELLVARYQTFIAKTTKKPLDNQLLLPIFED